MIKEKLVGTKNFSSISRFEGFSKHGVAVTVVKYQDVFVAGAGGDREASSQVTVIFATRLRYSCDSSDNLISTSSRLGEDWIFEGVVGFTGFCRPSILSLLIEVSFGCSDGIW